MSQSHILSSQVTTAWPRKTYSKVALVNPRHRLPPSSLPQEITRKRPATPPDLRAKARRTLRQEQSQNVESRPSPDLLVSQNATEHPSAKRIAYFNAKYDIKTSMSDVSSPGHLPPLTSALLDQESIIEESSCLGQYRMPAWDPSDPDIRANFWVDHRPESTGKDGWNQLGDHKWTDPEGRIALSSKQLAKISSWQRVTELTVPCPALNETLKKGRNGASVKTVSNVLDDQGNLMEPGAPLQPSIMREKPRARSIRQGFVGDCSFLSSLASLAEFEARMGSPVLSSILFPQRVVAIANGKEKIVPVINPNGMYACKIHFNGIARKVLIDDFVPVRKDGKVLSAHTSNKRDMWVTLLEKAFIKLMGGSYFVQGSNPGADLFHLTGWIPETIPFRKDLHTGSPDLFSPVVTGSSESANLATDPKWNAVWYQLHSGFTRGCCVACLGTSEVADAAPSGLDYPEGVSISSGIVARHAYSVMDVVEAEGYRLLFVRNPWACVRWKGTFAPGDSTWTPSLEAACGYSSAAAACCDTGSFWIQWKDVLKWFSHLYLCWNTSLLPIEKTIHSRWGLSPHLHSSLLIDDSHCAPYNPQFRLRIAPYIIYGPEDERRLDRSRRLLEVKIWILLSRHVRDRKRDLFQKYIACHVYQDSERQICPPAPVHQGVYSNGECALMRLNVIRPVRYASSMTPEELALWGSASQCSESKASKFFDLFEDINPEGINVTLSGESLILVISQYSQKGTFNFTIRGSSPVPYMLEELPHLINAVTWTTQTIRGAWTEGNAGGCSNDIWEYMTNPHFRLTIPRPCRTVLLLENPAELSVNVRLFKSMNATVRQLRSRQAISSGAYRPGCCAIDTFLAAGDHTIIVSTFKPREKGVFQLVCHVEIAPVENSHFSLTAQLSEEHICLLPNGDKFDRGPLRLLCLQPIPAAYRLGDGRDTPFFSRTFHSRSGSLHGLYKLEPGTPVTEITAQLRAPRELSNAIVPSMTLFYVFQPEHPLMKAYNSPKDLKFALRDLSLAAPSKKRFRRTKMLVQGWSSASDVTRDCCAAIVRRTDLEGGPVNLERSDVVFSTAAEQFYHMTRTVTLSNTRLYQTSHKYGFYCLEVSSLPLTFFKSGNAEDVAQMTRADWAKCWKLSHYDYSLRIITDKEVHITELPIVDE